MTTAVVVVLAIVCSTVSAFPTEPAVLTPGSRVRITAPQLDVQPFVGTLVGLGSDGLLVKRGRSHVPTLIPRSFVVRLEVSGGRKSQAGRGTLIGAGVGAMPGLLLTFGDYNSDTEPSPGVVAAVGAASGAAVGAAIGWALKSEDWQPAELPAVAAGVTPLPGGGLGVSLRVRWGKTHVALR
jgi:hypothetical protein